MKDIEKEVIHYYRFDVSFQVNVNELDPKIAYIQVTHSKPYFCKDELETRQNFFEQNHDVDTFQFETPFTKSGAAHGSVEDQWKRRTILTSNFAIIKSVLQQQR